MNTSNAAETTTPAAVTAYPLPRPYRAGMASKDSRGDWRCESTAMLSETHELSIVTRKRSNGELMTTAMVAVTEPGSSWKTSRIYHDFSSTLESERVRVTGPAVQRQHDYHLDDTRFNDTCRRALLHYRNLGEIS